jgi:ATP-binding cassette, subfamily B, bacterial
MPIFSGHLVDALTRGAADPAARHAALSAFGAIVARGLLSMILRFAGLQAIVPFTLRIMSDVAAMRHAGAAFLDRLARQQLCWLDRA